MERREGNDRTTASPASPTRRLCSPAAALAVGTAFALTAVAGCASPARAPVAAPDAKQLAVFTPAATHDAGKVVWNLPYGEPSSLDWTKAYSYSENTVVANLCEGLYRLTPDYKVVPNLATATVHPDPTTYVYTIRQGVTFWDGSPMTATDVVYSLSRQLDPSVASLWAGSYQHVKSITKTGAYQVTVKLTKPDALFDRWLATAAGDVGSAKFYTAKGAAAGTPTGGEMCTGQYKVQSWKVGQSVTLVRNDAYWDRTRLAKTKTFEFRWVMDEAPLTNALLTGQIDGTYDAPLSGLGQLRTGAPGKLWLGKTQQSVALVFSTRKSPLQDIRIRQALQLAIDYQGIDKQIYKDTASPLRAYGGTGIWGYAQDMYSAAYAKLPAAQTDLAAARKLVKDAGSPKGEIVIASVSDQPLYSQLATVVQDAGKKVGLNIRLQSFPTSTYTTFFSDVKARSQVDAFFTTNYTDLPEPLELYGTFRPGEFFNFGAYDNAATTAAINKALVTEDDAQRAEFTVQAQAQITKDVAVLPIAEPANRLFMNNRITGAPASFVYLYAPWAADVGAK
ncbi:ABC transporter substrate-binding protein [Streptomyces atratus]|uniref:ABC transporter substrate-binding protein n=1 Tax=Streptomyces atratus TaxID=1893 RepID=UPI0016706C70|nr:ABC transporter substrate-binding protein [Streptomyces atratus]WPW26309.1 ABC transporter substrate-binding protein [Streptomyces atratus]GGT65840.1 glycosyl transferase [Streptomyces atratus]